MVPRLQPDFPGLLEKLTPMSVNEKRTLILSLCKRAVTATSNDEMILSIIRSAESENHITIETKAHEIAQFFDDEYLSLNEKADKSKQDEVDELRFFASARIATALTYLPKLDQPSEAQEALYEVLMAFDDPIEAANNLLNISQIQHRQPEY